MVAMIADDLPEVMTSAEIAQRERVTIRAVELWVSRGVDVGGHRVFLAGRKAGRVLRIPREAYREFLRQCNLDTWREAAEQQKR